MAKKQVASLANVRRLFPATKKVKYFYNGGICAIPTPVERKLREFIGLNLDGFSDENWRRWNDDVSAAYRLFAGIVGAKETEVVGVPNTSTGTGLIAHMIDPKKGSNIVLDDLEYSTIYPFTIRAKQGVELRIVKSRDGRMDVRDIEKAVDDKTSAVVVSSVSCWNGYRYNLREISEVAHRHGAYLAADVAQQVGAVRFDVKRDGVDFLSTCGHKWLLAPPGTGFMYVSEELAGKFDPPLPGWMGITDPSTFEVWKPTYPKTAQRFETGLPNFMLLGAARASMEMLNGLGRSRIEDEILKRTGYLIENLQETGVKLCTPAESAHRAGLVTFLLKKHQQLYDELIADSFILFHHPPHVIKNMRWPMGGIRVDPSFFNTFEELDELVAHVRNWAPA